MKFGLLYEMETPRPWHDRSEYNVYWEALAQIERADQLGFDHVWEVEHHFLEEYSHSSAPEVFFGAVSQRTKDIRISHGVRLLPFNFNHPIKLAEQAAVLDIMSNGRVEFGTGRSTTSMELDGFGVDYERTRAEVREALGIIVKAWTEDILEWDGPLMKIPPSRVVPKPIQRPHPPMWMACVAPDSYTMAGDRGLGVLSFSLNWEQVQKAMGRYREAFAQRSDQVPLEATEQFASMAIVHVATDAAGVAVGLDGARWFLHHVAKLFEPLMAKNELYSYDYLRRTFGLSADAMQLSDDELREHPMVVVGTPDEVVEKLGQFQAAGLDQVICFKQAGRIPHENIMSSLDLMGRHVIGEFNPDRRPAAVD
jgi:alkanesulfonate monooxygenase SsuD/methylene tetrahydromethanopterin reductase-like flavin-dependent oxidoreductase (luciferase family)